jgi:hypothetical protein
MPITAPVASEGSEKIVSSVNEDSVFASRKSFRQEHRQTDAARSMMVFSVFIFRR